jgi:hypothetical protein
MGRSLVVWIRAALSRRRGRNRERLTDIASDRNAVDSRDDQIVLPVPAGHRTDWGEAFLTALEPALIAIDDETIDHQRSRTTLGRGGSLVTRLTGPSGEDLMTIKMGEDLVSIKTATRKERIVLSDGDKPGGRIPIAVERVTALLPTSPPSVDPSEIPHGRP